MGKVALVAGSTGLIGNQLIDLLLASDRYDRVIAISRSPLAQRHEKLVNVVCGLDQLALQKEQLKCDDVFCCLGTTMRKAKTKEAFLKVDVEAPIQLANLTHELGAQQFLLVSALGANEKSSLFYNRAKGLAEAGIQKVGFRSVYFFRPSLLTGPRVEQRSGEDAAKFFYRWLGFLIPAKYQAIESIKVARAMLAKAQEEKSGANILESIDIQKF